MSISINMKIYIITIVYLNNNIFNIDNYLNSEIYSSYIKGKKSKNLNDCNIILISMSLSNFIDINLWNLYLKNDLFEMEDILLILYLMEISTGSTTLDKSLYIVRFDFKQNYQNSIQVR